MSGVDKFVREAMPIQEEEKALGKRAAKARPTLKTVIKEWLGLDSHGTETMD